MAVQGGAKCIKYLMFFFNFIFFICGIGIIVGGALTLTVYKEYVDFTGSTGEAIPIVLICVGVFIFLTGFFGCCGAVKENYCMLSTYTFIMVVLLIIEVAAGIAGYVLRDDIDQAIGTEMSEYMKSYNSSDSAMEIFDKMQQELKCCGTYNYTDWFGYNDTQGYDSVPLSCCTHMTQTGCNLHVSTDASNIYTEACYDSLKSLLLQNIAVIAGVAIGVAVIEIFGIVFACCLIRAIKSEYEVV